MFTFAYVFTEARPQQKLCLHAKDFNMVLLRQDPNKNIFDFAFDPTLATSQQKLSKQDPTTKATHQSKMPAPKQC